MSKPWAALRRLASVRVWLHMLKLVNFYGANHVEQRRRLAAGPGLRMSPSASLRNAERVTLGRDVHVGERCCLWAGDSSGRITLGDHALLGPEVFITASNYQTGAGRPVMHQPKDEQDVVVGSDVWLGVRVTVLPGVTIGDGAVVAAGAVVTRSLPPGCIAAGVPARPIAYRAVAAAERAEAAS
jgi:acetyltransferase-like isoleucine patch superfamily enzyme